MGWQCCDGHLLGKYHNHRQLKIHFMITGRRMISAGSFGMGCIKNGFSDMNKSQMGQDQ